MGGTFPQSRFKLDSGAISVSETGNSSFVDSVLSQAVSYLRDDDGQGGPRDDTKPLDSLVTPLSPGPPTPTAETTTEAFYGRIQAD